MDDNEPGIFMHYHRVLQEKYDKMKERPSDEEWQEWVGYN